ncbi:MAG TPA: Mpo1-like protein [Azospirillaceae bacterium]|nr:Mpo1-like protein [Azospirillaceae bacterium]
MGDLFERQMAMYVTYHRDARNRATHFLGIPAIVFSLIQLSALVRLPVGEQGLSLAVALTVAVWALWVALNRPIGLAMALFLAPCVWLAEWVAATQGPATVWWVFGATFVGGWALQLWGHVYEGKRPALLSNLFQALIGPMFLVAEIFEHLGLQKDLRDRVETIARAREAGMVKAAAE